MKKIAGSIIAMLLIQVAFLFMFCSNNYGQQYYFSKELYKDPGALSKAMPVLAQQISFAFNDRNRILTDSNKQNYYDTAFQYEMAAQHYKRSIELLDSSSKYGEDYFGRGGIEFASYAYAKDGSNIDSASFGKAYIAALKHLYENLSYEKKIAIELVFDTGMITSSSKDFYKIVDTLRNKNSDSISLHDAQTLVTAYNSYNVYSTVVPLAMPFINDLPLKIMYPVIKNKWSGVFPVNHIDEVPNPALKYNLLMEITSGIKDKKDSNHIRYMNGAFSEAGRLLNLHIAAGVPKKNIHIVAVVHAAALYYLLNNETYKKKYGVDNPNIAILKELKDAGVTFVACGQAMHFFTINKEEMMPGIKISLTAQTVLSSYQLQHYVYYDLSERQ